MSVITSTLDEILKLYIEEWKEVDAIVAAGFEKPLVERILKLVDTNAVSSVSSTRASFHLFQHSS